MINVGDLVTHWRDHLAYYKQPLGLVTKITDDFNGGCWVEVRWSGGEIEVYNEDHLIKQN